MSGVGGATKNFCIFTAEAEAASSPSPGHCSTIRIAGFPHLPLPSPNHRHRGANGEWPDGEHFNVIYLLIRKHKFAFLFNWLSDLWEFYCKRSTVLIGCSSSSRPGPSRYLTPHPCHCLMSFPRIPPFGNIPSREGASQYSLAQVRPYFLSLGSVLPVWLPPLHSLSG